VGLKHSTFLLPSTRCESDLPRQDARRSQTPLLPQVSPGVWDRVGVHAQAAGSGTSLITGPLSFASLIANSRLEALHRRQRHLPLCENRTQQLRRITLSANQFIALFAPYPAAGFPKVRHSDWAVLASPTSATWPATVACSLSTLPFRIPRHRLPSPTFQPLRTPIPFGPRVDKSLDHHPVADSSTRPSALTPQLATSASVNARLCLPCKRPQPLLSTYTNHTQKALAVKL